MPASEASYRASAGARFRLYTHLVFVTKYRKRVLTAAHFVLLETIYRQLCLEQNCVLVEFSGEADHVHLLVDYPPSLRLSDLVRRLKSVSSLRFATHRSTSRLATRSLVPVLFRSQLRRSPHDGAAEVHRDSAQTHMTAFGGRAILPPACAGGLSRKFGQCRICPARLG